MHTELVRELNSASPIKVMWAVQFFAQVIVNLKGGPRAFIDAEGHDVILALDMATSSELNFFHVHTLDGPQPYVWGDAAKVLSQYPETAVHQLLAILKFRRGSPSQFPASRGFLKEAKSSSKKQHTPEEELRIVGRCSCQSTEFGLKLLSRRKPR